MDAPRKKVESKLVAAGKVVGPTIAHSTTVYSQILKALASSTRKNLPHVLAGRAGSISAQPGAHVHDAAREIERVEQPVVDPLHSLKGLSEALAIMDAAVTQNIYLDKLLLYRDVKLSFQTPASTRLLQETGNELPSLESGGHLNGRKADIALLLLACRCKR
jgi:hypothetical protein